MLERVDFAIITALQVERTAIVDRLDCVEKIQEDGHVLTSYKGEVAVIGSEEKFSVVVIQLLNKGVAEAAVATAATMQRWNPRNVIMLGIAGGVRGKVQLGDVIVSKFSYYYEPGKVTPGGVQLIVPSPKIHHKQAPFPFGM